MPLFRPSGLADQIIQIFCIYPDSIGTAMTSSANHCLAELERRLTPLASRSSFCGFSKKVLNSELKFCRDTKTPRIYASFFERKQTNLSFLFQR